MDEFLQWEYTPGLDINLKILGKEFIENQPIDAEDFKLLIRDWQVHCRHIYCTVDLEDANLLELDVGAACEIIRELEDFSGNFGIIQSIKFINGGPILKTICSLFSFLIPEETRKLITLV
jgi:hypothetical protein